ncbi:MAG: hypothetical protein AAGI49_11120 [Bacteroidota bacterium]
MKSFVCLISLVTISYLAIGQDQIQDSTIIHEVGLDLNFVNVFLPLDNNVIGRRGGYQFYYRRYRLNKKILRMGLDIDLGGSFDRKNTDLARNNNRIDIDYRIGWGKQKDVFKKAMIFYGVDWLIEPFYSSTRVSESFKDAKDGNFRATYRLSTGAGPFLGLQYNFSTRLGIFTELNYYIRASFVLEDIRFEENALGDTATDRAITYSDLLRLPTSVALFYKF